MADPSPTMSLWLDGRQTIQLGQKGSAGTTPVLKVHMHDTSHAARLVIPSYEPSTRSFNLRRALQCGIFDLYDAESHTKIAVPHEDVQPEELTVEARAPLKLFNLKLDPQDNFWTELLTPGHTYEIYWAPNNNNTPWAYRGEAHQDAPERLPIRLGKQPFTYTLLDDATKPLHLSVSVKPTDKTCYMSGDPQFGLKLEVTSQHDEVITMCLDKTPLKELHGLEEIVEVVDEEGQQVDWGYGIGCWDGDSPERFPADDMFEELKPGVPYEETFWLTKVDEKGHGGELTDLESGKKYTGEVSKTLLNTLGNYQVGTKEQLLAGSEQEKKDRWAGRRGLVFLDVSDPFAFETV
ncbi:hypothetical protein SLS60_000200 [Paraconiothyrium brasiliense]|uniref:Uncharacterized protein n=1 Tax=Paraconiothyrium brasiliense TaxID=300254 RepID=A0ABR3S5Q7_9PLEO